MIAYKWLAELHGVLCVKTANDSEILYHQNEIENALQMAYNIQNKHGINKDVHLEFLFYKKNCKVNV